MKKIAFLSFIILLLSCSSDDSSNSLSDFKLSKETTMSSTGFTSTKTYIYQNGKIKKVAGNDNTSDEDDQIFIYDGEQLSQIKMYNRQNFDDPAHPITLSFHYSGEDIDSYIVSYDDNSSSPITYTNFYNNGRLNYQMTSDGIEGFHHEYYGNGNLFKIKNGNTVLFTYQQYDDKKNPYSLVYPDSYLRLQIYSPNNSLEITGIQSETYEYEYNSEDFPTKMIKKVNGIVQSTTNYFY